MGILNLAEAAARMAAVEADLEAAREPMIAAACQMVAGRSKDLIGVPQPSWPPLAAETLARKDGVNTPLLETGEMRSSISWNADRDHGHVGSNDDVAVFQELGTSRGLPPRSFLALAAQQEGPEVAKMMSKVVGAAIGGRLANGSRVGDFFHLAREVAHMVSNAVDHVSDALDESEQSGKQKR
jgi:phage gpG-like protein